MSALTKSFGVNGLSADILSGSGRVPPPWGVSAPECKSRCQVSSFKQPSNRERSLITTCILWLVAIPSNGSQEKEYVMDWDRRELETIQGPSQGEVGSAYRRRPSLFISDPAEWNYGRASRWVGCQDQQTGRRRL